MDPGENNGIVQPGKTAMGRRNRIASPWVASCSRHSPAGGRSPQAIIWMFVNVFFFQCLIRLCSAPSNRWRVLAFSHRRGWGRSLDPQLRLQSTSCNSQPLLYYSVLNVCVIMVIGHARVYKCTPAMQLWESLHVQLKFSDGTVALQPSTLLKVTSHSCSVKYAQ